MTQYLFQILFFQLIFLLIYDLLLKKETFFQWNRIYLLTTPLVSLILPLIKIPTIQEQNAIEYLVRFESTSTNLKSVSKADLEPIYSLFHLSPEVIWLVGIVISFLLFFRKMWQLNRIKYQGKPMYIEGYLVIMLPKTNSAFSFFKTIFLGENLSETQQRSIFLHEKIHVEQRHSLDLILFELMKIFLWFNPLVYLFQKKMIALHEFIADELVVQEVGKSEYYQNLLSQVFQTNQFSFTNTFFNQSLIKKRIVMIQKSKSKKISLAKFLLLIPTFIIMILFVSCNTSNDKNVLANIDALKESIMAQGEISDSEMDALKTLFVLTMPEGLKSNQFEDVKNLVEIPFLVIEKVPTFPGCSGDNESLKNCLNSNLKKILTSNFNKTITKKNSLDVRLEFKIGIDGQVSKINTIADNTSIENEITRIISTQIPTMIPGEHEGIKVGVFYEMPLTIQL